MRNVDMIRCLAITLFVIPFLFAIRSFIESNELGFFGYLTACIYALCFIYSHKDKLEL